ncbi:hypothetical protein [Defluviimonas sp. SAOS-178_SWC]|uniref:hypothetical protein n=1 Tax=Defluviimonas sp. SAOS-178_SWC TaxID=3121287 RepID=UPI0032216E08
MSNIRPSHLPAAGHRAHSATSRRNRALLHDIDRQQLMRHLASCEAAQQTSSPFLAPVIHRKIETSLPCGAEPPEDVVTGSCRVTYSIDGGEAQTGLLTHNARMPVTNSGVIPVPSLLGATLIGLRVGQTVPMLCEDGSVLRLTVLDVTHA